MATSRKQGDAASVQDVRVGVPRKGLLQDQQRPGGAALAFCSGHGSVPFLLVSNRQLHNSSRSTVTFPVAGREGDAGR